MQTDAKKLHSSVLSMIRVHNSKKIINIDKNFPVEKLVNIMRPYLLLYFMHKYSFTRNKRINAENELRYKLKFFMKLLTYSVIIINIFIYLFFCETFI
jgi:hypothetical protein